MEKEWHGIVLLKFLAGAFGVLAENLQDRRSIQTNEDSPTRFGHTHRCRRRAPAVAHTDADWFLGDNLESYGGIARQLFPDEDLCPAEIRVIPRPTAEELVTATRFESQLLNQLVRVSSESVGQNQGGAILVRPFLAAAEIAHHVFRGLTPIAADATADPDGKLQGRRTGRNRARFSIAVGVAG